MSAQFDIGKAFALLAQGELLFVRLQAAYMALRTTKFNTPEERQQALQSIADLANLYNEVTAEAKAIFASFGGSKVTAGDIDAALARDEQVPSGFNPPSAEVTP